MKRILSTERKALYLRALTLAVPMMIQNVVEARLPFVVPSALAESSCLIIMRPTVAYGEAA